MTIAIPPRKGLVARRIAEERPDLSTGQIAKIAGTDRGHVTKSLTKETFGRDKPKTRLR